MEPARAQGQPKSDADYEDDVGKKGINNNNNNSSNSNNNLDPGRTIKGRIRQERQEQALPSRPGAFSVVPGGGVASNNNNSNAAPGGQAELPVPDLVAQKIRANKGRSRRTGSPHTSLSPHRRNGGVSPKVSPKRINSQDSQKNSTPPLPTLKPPPLASSDDDDDDDMKPPASVPLAQTESNSNPRALLHASVSEPPSSTAGIDVKSLEPATDAKVGVAPAVQVGAVAAKTNPLNWSAKIAEAYGTDLSIEKKSVIDQEPEGTRLSRDILQKTAPVPVEGLYSYPTDYAVQGNDDARFNGQEDYLEKPGVTHEYSDYALKKSEIKMGKTPSGTELLPTLEAIRVSSSSNLVVATAEKDSCWAFFKRSRAAQMGACLGCLLIIALVVALSLTVFSIEDPTEDAEIRFFDELADPIDGMTIGNQFGSSVTLSYDGTRMAAADIEDVFVYDLDEVDGVMEWVLVATIKTPENATMQLGSGGSDIVRTAAVADISSDGKMIAIGWPYSLNEVGLEAGTGRVEVYHEVGNGIWEQLGNTIYGDKSMDFFGSSVSLSDDGNYVAAGSPGNGGRAAAYIFLNQGLWVEMGTPIDLGGALSVASVVFRDFTLGIAGQPKNEGGSMHPVARIFRFVAGDWQELANGILGNFENTAYIIEMSSDGAIVAISNYYTGLFEGELNDALDVRVFEWDGTDWIQMGDSLHTSSPGQKSGYFIALSSDGNFMSMGDPGRRSEDGLGVTGHIHVFKFKEETANWMQVGPNRDGDSPGDQFGCAISISGNGMVVAASAPFNRGEGFELGRLYTFDLTNYEEIGAQTGWGN